MPQQTHEKLWTGQYVLVLLTNLASQVIHALLLVVVPLYMLDLGAGNTVAGLATGLYSLMALAFRPIVGHFLDNHGRLWMMRLGLIPMALGVFLANFTDMVALQLAIRVLEGFGFAVTSTTAATMVSDLVPNSRMTEGIGYNGMIVSLTAALGPLVGLVLLDWFGFGILFWTVVPMAILPIFFSFFLKETGSPPDEPMEKISWKHFVAVERGAIPSSLMMLFAAVSYGAVVTFLAAFGKARGVENMQFFFVLFPCMVFISRLFTGRLVDRHGYASVVIPSLVFAIGSFAIVFFAYSVAMFSIVAVLYGLGYGTLIPAFNALAVQNSSPSRRGAANATFYIALDLGIGGGAILLGVLANFWGLSSSFVISALLMLVSLVLFPFLGGTRQCLSTTEER